MITILGASGFIGSYLKRHLEASNIPCWAPARGESLRGRDLGQVIDCAGITADFRVRPYDTVDAHVGRVADIARNCDFQSFVYLSSTRLYKDHPSSPARERDDIQVSPFGAGGLYNLSKATGEAVALTLGERGRVVRLSNVYGLGSEPHNFLASIIADALQTGRIELETSLDSAKDYVGVDDVVALLPLIAAGGREPVYNLASGANVTNGEIVEALARLTGCSVSVRPDAETWSYPEIDVALVRDEFGFKPSRLLDDLPALVESYRREAAAPAAAPPEKRSESPAAGSRSVTVDDRRGRVIVEEDGKSATYDLGSPEAFERVSDAWLRAGWWVKHIYTFSWMGRPIVQLPEDLVRLQELVARVRPDVIIELGVAHGGGLVFYASLCRMLGQGRVIGVDVEIRPHNREAIEAHPLFPHITLVEGDSVDPDIVERVKAMIRPGETVMLMLDSNHSKAHVAGELRSYSPLVTPGSWIVVMDGYIMQLVAGGPRTGPDWSWNNPNQAAAEFARDNPDFVLEEPEFLFNESPLSKGVTYYRGGYLKRVR